MYKVKAAQFVRTTLLLGILLLGLFALPNQSFAATCACYFGTIDSKDCKEVFIPDHATEAHCKLECKNETGKEYLSHKFSNTLYSEGLAVECTIVRAALAEKKALASAGPPDPSTLKKPSIKNQTTPTLNVKIPGLKFSEITDNKGSIQVRFIGEYIAAVYNYLLFAGITISIVLIMLGGFQYAFGRLSQTQIANAKKRIRNGIIGLVLLLSTTFILSQTNTSLLDAATLELILVQEEGMPESMYNEIRRELAGEIPPPDGDFPEHNKIIKAWKKVKPNPPTRRGKTTWSGRCNIFANRVAVAAGAKRSSNIIQRLPVVKDSAGNKAFNGFTILQLAQHADKIQPGMIIHMGVMWDLDKYNNENQNHYFVYAGKDKKGIPRFVHSFSRNETGASAQKFMDRWFKKDWPKKPPTRAMRNIKRYFKGKTIPEHPSRIIAIYNPFVEK